jgi:hypothetical protein
MDRQTDKTKLMCALHDCTNVPGMFHAAESVHSVEYMRALCVFNCFSYKKPFFRLSCTDKTGMVPISVLYDAYSTVGGVACKVSLNRFTSYWLNHVSL